MASSANVRTLSLARAGQQPRQDSLVAVAAAAEHICLGRLGRKGGGLLCGPSLVRRKRHPCSDNSPASVMLWSHP